MKHFEGFGRKRLTIAVAAALALGGLAALVVTYHSNAVRHQQETASLDRARKLVAEASISTERLLDIEVNDKSQITFDELFERAEEINKRNEDSIVELQLMNRKDSWNSFAIRYLGELEKINRSLAAKYRKTLELRQFSERAMSFAGQVDRTTWRELGDRGVEIASERLQATESLQRGLTELRRLRFGQDGATNFRLVDSHLITSALANAAQREASNEGT